MDTEKCRIYLTAVEAGSLTAAAERLGYTPSGVSRSIAALEEETGLRLLDRGRSGVCASADGEQLLPVMRELVHQARLCRETADRILGLDQGSVTIGISYAAYFRMLSRTMKEFRAAYPGVELRTVQGTSTELTLALREHRADLIIATEREGDFSFIPLREDPMLACVPKDHSAVREGVFSLKRFETEPMIAAYSDRDTDYARALRRAGVHPNIQLTATDVYASYCMVEAGLGVSMFNAIELEQWNGDAVTLPTDPPVLLRIGIMYRGESDLSASAQRFLELLKNGG